MLKNTRFKTLELLLLFFLLPISLSFSYPIVLKAGVVLLAVVYVIAISIKLRLFSWRELIAFKVGNYWKWILLIFTGIIGGTYLFMINVHPDKLFVVLKKSPLFWLGLTLFYSVFSVYPQEFLYRSFFFTRYNGLLKQNALVALNILVFPIAHLFFQSWLVLGITCIGGIFFSLSYLKTKSLLLTTLEHALYGSWLFTIGMGEMLGFPMPQ